MSLNIANCTNFRDNDSEELSHVLLCLLHALFSVQITSDSWNSMQIFHLPRPVDIVWLYATLSPPITLLSFVSIRPRGSSYM